MNERSGNTNKIIIILLQLSTFLRMTVEKNITYTKKNLNQKLRKDNTDSMFLKKDWTKR